MNAAIVGHPPHRLAFLDPKFGYFLPKPIAAPADKKSPTTCDPEIREVCAKAAKVFADQLGCKVEEASPWKDDYFGQFFTIVLAETDLRGMRELVAKYGDHMQPHLVDAIKGTMTDVQITDALVARKKCANQAWRFFRTYDLLLTKWYALKTKNAEERKFLLRMQSVGRS